MVYPDRKENPVGGGNTTAKWGNCVSIVNKTVLAFIVVSVINRAYFCKVSTCWLSMNSNMNYSTLEGQRMNYDINSIQLTVLLYL